MTVMAIGISAIVAGFSSGIVALNNAGRTGTAGTLADKQMEAYRALDFTNIPLLPPDGPGCPTIRTDCSTQSVTGPDGRAYVVSTVVTLDCPTGGTPPCS